MNENFLALYIWIFTDCTPEEAFNKLNGKQYKQKRVNPIDTLEMIAMREKGITYKEIASKYGINKDAVYSRIRHFKNNVNGKRGVYETR